MGFLHEDILYNPMSIHWQHLHSAIQGLGSAEAAINVGGREPAGPIEGGKFRQQKKQSIKASAAAFSLERLHGQQGQRSYRTAYGRRAAIFLSVLLETLSLKQVGGSAPLLPAAHQRSSPAI